MAHVKMGASVSSDFKQADDLIYLLGENGSGLAGSEFVEQFITDNTKLPDINLDENAKLYRLYRLACEENLLQSGHDVSDGGMLCAITESAIGGRLGAELETKNSLEFYFNEAPARFIVSVSPENKEAFEAHFSDTSYLYLGRTTTKPQIIAEDNTWQLDELITTWKEGIKS